MLNLTYSLMHIEEDQGMTIPRKEGLKRNSVMSGQHGEEHKKQCIHKLSTRKTWEKKTENGGHKYLDGVRDTGYNIKKG